MADREKVIKGLGSCVEYFASRVKGVMFDEWLEESRKAIALQKEQEPVKPIRLENWWECPSCNGNIVANMKYCPECGKAVKWDG